MSGVVVPRGFCALSAAGAPDLLASLTDGVVPLPVVMPPLVPPDIAPPDMLLPVCVDEPPVDELLRAVGFGSPPIVEAPGALVLWAKARVDDKAKAAAAANVTIFMRCALPVETRRSIS